eukprot:2027663-Pleurochrysis_carterae.AAC.9
MLPPRTLSQPTVLRPPPLAKMSSPSLPLSSEAVGLSLPHPQSGPSPARRSHSRRRSSQTRYVHTASEASAGFSRSRVAASSGEADWSIARSLLARVQEVARCPIAAAIKRALCALPDSCAARIRLQDRRQARALPCRKPSAKAWLKRDAAACPRFAGCRLCNDRCQCGSGH